MTDLNSIFKKFNSKQGVSMLNLGSGPKADWRAIFVSTAVLIVLVSLLNAYMFFKVDKSEIFVVEEPTGEENTLDLEKLKETTRYYQNKAMEFERIKKATNTPVVDPSL